MTLSAALFLAAMLLGMAGLTARSNAVGALCLGSAILTAILALLSLPLPA